MPFSGTKEMVLASFHFSLAWGQGRNVPFPQACVTLWNPSCPLSTRNKKVKKPGPKQSQKIWQDSSPWHSNPAAWKNSGSSSSPWLFLQYLSLFSLQGGWTFLRVMFYKPQPGRKPVASAFRSATYFAGFMHPPLVTLLIRGSGWLIKKQRLRNSFKKTAKLKCEVFWKEKANNFFYACLLIFHYYFRSSWNPWGKIPQSYRRT